MRFGVDYAWGDPGVSALEKAGVTFVCRYLSYPGNTKNLRPDEAARLLKAGIDIVTVFETTTARALSGYDGGAHDAFSANQQLLALGAPAGAPVYFTVDFDAAYEQPHIDRYLRGAAKVIGLDRVGVYGGYWVVKRCFDAGVVKYGWQTYAWSGGRWEPRAQLQQYSNGHRLNGVAVDYDRAVADDFGQWPRSRPKRRRPLPGPARKPAWFWEALREFLRRRYRT